MRETIKLMKVLSDESRLRVLNLIQERECCVCEVMLVMGISQSKASRICSALYDTGLLHLQREGRWARYSINSESAKGFVGDILTGIKKSLADNPAAQADLDRLREVEKMMLNCASEQCMKEIPESVLRLKNKRQTA
jgi:ArsR family transcriptional regulator, arsenate/arsenite/antimonite-responsive transcriptional repressor